ncbi:hypothetical protein TW95_gp0719 [Pandoravirus inopinatum]|uniref:Uncharacterized protein n=1 Tax=Pandoravirus inopinatum TaxID=1605721 RepID=A0A0B5IXG6_9VIRU|nr:hypothetical protein TW95_gp0719 [Pandoravirus inopinatum]AJF97453.1 hypothetical protein [Pandoravirus inopinatum]
MSKFYIVEPVPTGHIGIAEDHHAILNIYNAIQDRKRELAQRHKTRRDIIDSKSCAHLARLCGWMARAQYETLIAKERIALALIRVAEQARDFVGRHGSDRPAKAIEHLERLSRDPQDRNAPYDMALALLSYAMCGHKMRDGAMGETVEPLLSFSVAVQDIRGILGRAHASFLTTTRP